jgi:hypothetical protein
MIHFVCRIPLLVPEEARREELRSQNLLRRATMLLLDQQIGKRDAPLLFNKRIIRIIEHMHRL